MLHSAIEPSPTPEETDIIERLLGRVAFDREGVVLRINDRMLELFHFEGWDLIGRNKSIFHSDHGGEGLSAVIARVTADGVPFAGDLPLTRRDGSMFWAEVNCVPIAGADNMVREVVVLLRDATQRVLAAADEAGQITAINAAQGVIHFTPDGFIMSVNPIFLAATGYSLTELVGQHHDMLLDPAEAASADYVAFWNGLRSGRHAAGEFRRINKNGQSLWLRANYSPIVDHTGTVTKVVKYATDITAEKQRAADFKGQIAAIHLSQCVATYALDGTILSANELFLDTVGYTMAELEGRHHRIFVDPAYAHSLEYEIFWSDLASGRYRSGEFRRSDRNGRDIWFQSIYSPVLDQDGKPFKVVNYATAITREKLRQADHQGQIAALHKSQAVASFTPEGIILDANENFLELTGYRLSQVLGRHHTMFLATEDRAGDYDHFWRDLSIGEYKGGEFKLVGRDDSEIWIQASYNPILDMKGRPFKVVMNAVDVTEQRLRQSDYEGQIAAINKSQCVVSFDLDGLVIDANENFLKLMQYSAEEVRGLPHKTFVDPATIDSPDYQALWIALREGRFQSSKFRRIAKNGSDVWIQASYNPIYDLNGRPFKVVEIATDITADVGRAADLTRAQREVQHDAATGLPNRLGLRRFLRDKLSVTDSELALLYLDLDHFKPINDTFGHEAGDHVLKTVAQRLREQISETQIVARIGGDEFIVASPSVSRDDVAALAGRLIEAVSRPIPYRDRVLEVGLSIGVALTPGDTLDEDELFRFADVALYRSKGSQRGTVSFYGEHSEASAEAERHLAHEMRIAVKAKQFTLACTPWHTGPDQAVNMIAVEPHWHHATLGELDQDRFLRVAEQSGLIVPLGDWTTREACRLALTLPGITVSVPIFPRQMLSSDVPGMIALALRETGLEPRRLSIRIERGTSRVAPSTLAADLAAISALGVAITGDSFMVEDDLPGAWSRFPLSDIAVDKRIRSRLDSECSEMIDRAAPLPAGETGFEPGRPARQWRIDRDNRLSCCNAGPVFHGDAAPLLDYIVRAEGPADAQVSAA
ncbi:PAS domain S-box protein [Sphingomonas sp.]|uniref:sensor domain-containing protein n=1 Tax=Sphingomonas sp. TaxID=28214 RepID=UPI0035C85629